MEPAGIWLSAQNEGGGNQGIWWIFILSPSLSITSAYIWFEIKVRCLRVYTDGEIISPNTPDVKPISKLIPLTFLLVHSTNELNRATSSFDEPAGNRKMQQLLVSLSFLKNNRRTSCVWLKGLFFSRTYATDQSLAPWAAQTWNMKQVNLIEKPQRSFELGASHTTGSGHSEDVLWWKVSDPVNVSITCVFYLCDETSSGSSNKTKVTNPDEVSGRSLML